MENYYEITIVGRAANTPSLRETKKGVPVTNFGIWVNYDLGLEEGEEPARDNELFQVAVFGRKAEAVVKTVKTGTLLIITSQQAGIDNEGRCIEFQAETVGIIPRVQGASQRVHGLTGEEYEVVS